MRILLVDDDPGLRTLLKTTFEVADVDVVEAESADVARRRIKAARPDVIVLDIKMPGTTGLELCAELKGAPETKDIPIVLLTGSDGGTSAEAIYQLEKGGMRTVLSRAVWAAYQRSVALGEGQLAKHFFDEPAISEEK